MRKNDAPLKNILEAWLAEQPFSSKIYLAQIKSIWQQNMGKTINENTKEITLKKYTLTLHISSSTIRHELTINKDKICKMFNDEIGKTVVKEVIIF